MAEFAGRAARRAKRTTEQKIKSWESRPNWSGSQQPVTPGYRLFRCVHGRLSRFLWNTIHKHGMVKLRPYVAPVKTPVLHIVVQLLILCDSWPKRHLTTCRFEVPAACLWSVIAEGVAGSAGLVNWRLRQSESKGGRGWGQFNKSGAMVEMVFRSGKGCGNNGL